MTNKQWEKLLAVINGEIIDPLPVGFVIDSPWLPEWAGVSILDYFTSEEIWLEANLKAVRQFPEVMFLPGFWSEYGMCAEPSAFGAKCVWQENDLPFAYKIIQDVSEINNLSLPNPTVDGLCPFVLKRLLHNQSRIEQSGHAIKFAVSRGSLNIASFLMGTTEFLLASRTDRNQIHKLLNLVTDFIVSWLETQIKTFPSIDGVFILDDIVGFLGDADFQEIVRPYLKKIFQTFDVPVKFFHNDAAGLVCAPYLPEIGINLFNFGFVHTIAEMQQLTKNQVTLLGNIPPRDVLAGGTAEQVQQCVTQTIAALPEKSRVILSCGGGVPGGVSTENMNVFLAAVKA